MTNYYDVFGVFERDINCAQKQLENILGIEFSEREGDFNGEYLLANIRSDIEFKLLQNEIHGELVEEDFPRIPLIVNISSSNKDNEITRELIKHSDKYSLLHRTEVEPGKLVRKFKFENKSFVLIKERILG